MPSRKRLTTKKAAKRLGLKPSTLENWRNLGKGPAYLKIGSRVFYEDDTLLAFEEQSRRTSTSQSAA